MHVFASTSSTTPPQLKKTQNYNNNKIVSIMVKQSSHKYTIIITLQPLLYNVYIYMCVSREYNILYNSEM